MNHFISRRIQYLLALTLALLILQGTFRLLFWGLISDLPMSFESHLLKAYWIGLRFDLRVSMLATLATLPWLLVPRFSAVSYQLLRNGLKLWVGFILVAILAVYVIDTGHYLYLHKRLDASISRFTSDMADSTNMVWQSYPVIQIAIATFVLWLIIYRFHNGYILTLLSQQAKPRKWYSNSLHVIVFGAVILLILMGRWSLVPLRWNHAYFNGNAQVAALGLNPFVWVYDTSKFTIKPVNKSNLQSHLPTLSRILGTEFSSLSAKQPLDRLVTPASPVVLENSVLPNVVVIFMESLGSTHIGAYGNPLDPTPNLDTLIKTSRWYSNFNVPVRSTAKSVFTSITGIPDITAVKTATRNPYMTHQRSVINSFQHHKKFYMLGGSAGWANMSATVNNSIDDVTLYEEKDWTSKIVDVWGISDYSLFKEAAKILSASKAPFFAYIQTAANHRPYTIADDGSGFVTRKAAAEELKQAGFNGNDQYNAVRLLDHNIGELLTMFKTEHIYDNTIFVLFADHQGIPPKVSFMPNYIYQFDIDDLPVPLIIHSNDLIMPEQSLAFGNLADLLPTIAGLFPQPYLNTTLGRDLAADTTSTLPSYAFVPGKRESVMFNSKHIGSFNHVTGETRSANVDAQGTAHFTETPNSMVDAANAYYTAAQYLLRANVKPPK